MPYNNKVITSIHGRRLGIQRLSSAESGGSDGTVEYLVGPEAFRVGTSTAETTAANVSAFGASLLMETSAASSSVYTIDPPVPGVSKTLYMSSGTWVKTGGAVFYSSAGTTHTTLNSSNKTVFTLMGVTTGIYALNTNGANPAFAVTT